MLIVRNAGNLVPHSRLYGIDSTTTEPAALELGVIVNNVKHIVVCGHSDCKVYKKIRILEIYINAKILIRL